MPGVESKDIPQSGPGSKTPQQVPTLHTPKGEGTASTGVNVTKTPGQPGAPKTDTAPAAGGAPGTPPTAGGKAAVPVVPQKSPQEILDDRSEEALATDLKDLSVSLGNEDISTLSLDKVLDYLIDTKDWRVDRLKELIPTRDESEILKYFSELFSSTDNQNGVKPEDVQSTSQKRSQNFMDSNVQVKDGTLVLANPEESLNKIAQAINKIESTRMAVQEAQIRSAGIEALKDGLGMESPLSSGLPLPAEDDVPALLKSLKSEIEELTKLIRDFDKSKGGMGLSADTSLKADALKEKGKKEIDASKPFFEKKDEKKAPSGPIAPTGEEKKPEPAGEPKPEPKKEEPKAASETSEVKLAEDKKNEKKDEKKEEGKDDKKEDKKDDKMDEKKAQEAKEAFVTLRAKLAAAREKKAQLYPFTDKNKQNQSNINAQMAKDAAKTIDKDISSGDPVTDKTEGFLGVNREKSNPSAPDMKISEKAKMSADSTITLKQAATKIAHEVKEATSKARLAIDLAGRQQLKGLITNPLKEALVKELGVAGMDPETAEAIVHNAMVDGYEDTIKLITAEAFDTFMNYSFDEFEKVKKFTDEHNPAHTASVTEPVEVKNEVKTASVTLKPAETSATVEGEFGAFWRNTYASQTGRRR